MCPLNDGSKEFTKKAQHEFHGDSTLHNAGHGRFDFCSVFKHRASPTFCPPQFHRTSAALDSSPFAILVLRDTWVCLLLVEDRTVYSFVDYYGYG